ncbi:phage major capsid protein [Mycobacteroides abscessus]|uniref:phage major capsid protein n=1 Tax=Mycobacteroides abscessus TaxID=36809 RepID=UPI000E6A0642|nr:phage major capsid protein [Mycobacteroides abscessus]RIT73430.1 phage major capsid protein [Mycobacteroides abscessus]
MSARKELLRKQAQDLLPDIDRARDIAEKADAEGREMTSAEKAIYDPIMAKAAQVADALRQVRTDEAVWEDAKSFAAKIGHPFGANQTPASSEGQRLAFTKAMAAKIADSMFDGSKALAPSGATVVGQEFTPDPVPLGRPVNSLLAILPVETHGPKFAYLRQSTRTNNAAVVAEGALKPTSVYSVTRVEDELKVIAHLSEGVPRYWFVDNKSMEQFLDNELQYGLSVAVEAHTLAAIDSTSGIQINAYATSALVTLRKSLTKIETAGYTPAAIVLAPGDWEGIELAISSQNAIEHMSLPYDASARRLYGVPVVVSLAQADGVAHTLAEGAAAIDTDGTGVQVQWSETSNADDFAHNLIRARCEGRFATSVFSPLGVVKSDLTP